MIIRGLARRRLQASSGIFPERVSAFAQEGRVGRVRQADACPRLGVDMAAERRRVSDAEESSVIPHCPGTDRRLLPRVKQTLGCFNGFRRQLLFGKHHVLQRRRAHRRRERQHEQHLRGRRLEAAIAAIRGNKDLPRRRTSAANMNAPRRCRPRWRRCRRTSRSSRPTSPASTTLTCASTARWAASSRRAARSRGRRCRSSASRRSSSART